MLVTLHFEKLWFSAYHGVHEQETRAGNEFEATVHISFDHPESIIESMDDTINYADVYAVIKKEMEHPRALLETVATTLAAGLKERYPQIKSISIHLYKLTVPIPNLAGRVGVSITKEY